jgi:acyl carrier protein
MTTALEIERMILRWLSGVVGPKLGKSIDPQESFFAYGIDSLAMLNLGIQLSESLQRSVSVEEMLDHATPRELAEFLAGTD